MTADKGLSRFVWPVVVILTLVLIGVPSLFDVALTDVMKVYWRCLVRAREILFFVCLWI